MLNRCLDSLMIQSDHKPDEIIIIDDGSSDVNNSFIMAFYVAFRGKARIRLWLSSENAGIGHSVRLAFGYIHDVKPERVYFIESDYVFNSRGLDVLDDLFKNTEEGRLCCGVSGYDHSNFYDSKFTNPAMGVFATCMKQQIGEDNVLREHLYKPFPVTGSKYKFHVELASNTCLSSYLNWSMIETVAKDQPELWDLIEKAKNPKFDPKYPQSGIFEMKRSFDDGMFSHAISICWNRWAIKNGIDRRKYAAWLNIKPSVAVHHYEGGMNG